MRRVRRYLLGEERRDMRSLRAVAVAGTTVVALMLVGVGQASADSDALVSRLAGQPGVSGAPTPGSATNSALGNIYGLAVDSAGNVYAVDSSACEIVKITPQGALSVIAGDGTCGTTASGLASATHLNDPQGGIVVNAAGDIFFSNSQQYEVDEITPDGQLSVFAGTGSAGAATFGVQAASSELYYPEGLALDSAGNLYIADGENYQYYKVSKSGILTLVAGSGTAGTPTVGVSATSSDFRFPTGIAVAPDGTVYLADYSSDQVFSISSSGNLTLVAGSYNNYGYPTEGPAASSELGAPQQLAVDAQGNLYVADYEAVSEVSPGGVLSWVAGNGTDGAPVYGQPADATPSNYPAAVAVAPDGKIYVGDSGNYTIDLVAPVAPTVSTAPSISGTTTVGQTLTATTGTWTSSEISYSYQWQDCDGSGSNCVAISGATTSTYTLAGGDAGHTIRVVVTATNPGGSASSTSAATAAVAAAPAASTAPVATASAATLGTQTEYARSTLLKGLISGYSGGVSYLFEYGLTTGYGESTTAGAGVLALDGSGRDVSAWARGLIPGTTYHYRLVVSTDAGAVTDGADVTFHTERIAPGRVRDKVTRHGRKFVLHEWLILRSGITTAQVCSPSASTTMTVTRGSATLARRSVRLNANCTFTTAFSFRSGQLPGRGRLQFHIHYGGNRHLLPRQALTLWHRYIG
jgi:sugar lactone lactonase YvrE